MAAKRRCNWIGVDLMWRVTGSHTANGCRHSRTPLKASRATSANFPGNAGYSADTKSSMSNSRPLEDTMLVTDGKPRCERLHRGSATH